MEIKYLNNMDTISGDQCGNADSCKDCKWYSKMETTGECQNPENLIRIMGMEFKPIVFWYSRCYLFDEKL